MQERVELSGYLPALLPTVGGFAPTSTGSVIDTDPGVGRDGWGDPGPPHGGLAQTGFQHHGGTARAGAVQVQPVPAHVDQCTRGGVGDLVGRLPRNLIARTGRGQGQRGQDRVQQPSPGAADEIAAGPDDHPRDESEQRRRPHPGEHTVPQWVGVEEGEDAGHPMNSAGATAHRCGWSLYLTDKTAISAQPRPKARRTPPARMFSWGSRNGAATATAARTAPAANEPTTISPMGRTRRGFSVRANWLNAVG